MSLYYVQKLLYQLNRDPLVRKRFETNRDELLAEYALTDEERGAIADGDIGLLYVMGVNGQNLDALLGADRPAVGRVHRLDARRRREARAGARRALQHAEGPAPMSLVR